MTGSQPSTRTSFVHKDWFHWTVLMLSLGAGVVAGLLTDLASSYAYVGLGVLVALDALDKVVNLPFVDRDRVQENLELWLRWPMVVFGVGSIGFLLVSETRRGNGEWVVLAIGSILILAGIAGSVLSPTERHARNSASQPAQGGS